MCASALEAEQATFELLQEELELCTTLEQLRLLEQEKNLQQACESMKGLSVQDNSGSAAANEKDETERELEEAIALSLQPLPKEELKQIHEKSDSCDPDLVNMQLLVDMGFKKEHAIWGVKQSGGNLDLAKEHASWKADADIMMSKRRRLEEAQVKANIVDDNEMAKSTSIPLPQPAAICSSHVFYLIQIFHLIDEQLLNLICIFFSKA